MIDYNEITECICRFFPKIQAVYLFGSFADGSEQFSSDVDLAILLPQELVRELTAVRKLELSNALSPLLHRDADIVNLREVSTVFQKEIICYGERIYCSDPDAADEFEMLTLSFYQKLNSERRDILEHGLKTGVFVAHE